MRPIVKRIILILLLLLFLPAGVMHFSNPQSFVNQLPGFLKPPVPGIIVWTIGGLQIVGGIGVLLQRTRQLACWAMIVASIALVPINIYMALNPNIFLGITPEYVPWLKVAMNILLIGFVWWFRRSADSPATTSG